MTATIENNQLVVRLPIEEKASATGKNILIANSHGAQKPGLTHKGKPVSINVTAYFKP